MKKIAIMDTSIASFNLGDQIIMESSRRALNPITKDAFVVNFPTHSPLFHKYEFSIRRKDDFASSLDSFDYKFVCGTNLIEKDMKKRKNLWNLHVLDSKYINGFILVGVGTDGLPGLQNKYTQKFYDRMLSHDFLHSTRDEKTKIFLENMGFKAINTGCTTLWSLTKEHCNNIPHRKSSEVVFTITDYCRDPESDKKLIKMLCSEYTKVYFWPQGMFDYEYFSSLGIKESLVILQPSLAAYNEFLINNDCDFVGTRLHAGIKAMQAGKRSIILGVDNRAKDMFDTYRLNYVDRNDFFQLKNMIYNELVTDIELNQSRIKKFIGQFK